MEHFLSPVFQHRTGGAVWCAGWVGEDAPSEAVSLLPVTCQERGEAGCSRDKLGGTKTGITNLQPMDGSKLILHGLRLAEFTLTGRPCLVEPNEGHCCWISGTKKELVGEALP